MKKVDYDKHAEWVSNLPEVKGGKIPFVIHRTVADILVERGEWDKYKRYFVVGKDIMSDTK